MRRAPHNEHAALPVVERGAPSSILAVHGFGGGPGSFDAVADHLPLAAVTLPGHDGVPPATFAQAAAMLAATTTATTILWGYSLGARLALAAAALTPLAGLVLESGRLAVKDDARVALDDARASDLEARGIDAFFADWDNGPLFAHLDAQARHQRRQLRRHHEAGALATVLRNFSAGVAPASFTPLSTPVLLVVGERDVAFRAHAATLQKIFASTQLFIADGCGHQPHIEDPTATALAVKRFTSSLTARAEFSNLEQRS